ncbi:MAG: hypothetical protein ACM3X4_06555 [Ignavibacteriales bacterium]
MSTCKATMAVALLCLVTTGCVQAKQKIIGPNLISVEETARVAKEQGGLDTVSSVDLTTNGPTYRIVSGFDSTGRAKAVWVEDRFLFAEYLDRGISREKALEIARREGLTGPLATQLLYVSPWVKANIRTVLKNSDTEVFWWVRDPGVELKYELYLDFYNGSIVYKRMIE